MLRTLSALSLSSLICAFGGVLSASALTVAPGCDAPNAAKTGRDFYVDPLHGGMENDGSAARPWRTLEEVFQPQRRLIATRARPRDAQTPEALEPINPGAPVKPGDRLVLLSGDHGDVDVRKMANSDFITIIGPEDRSAVLRSLKVVGASHWRFKNLKVQANRPASARELSSLTQISGDSFHGMSDNIIVETSSFSSQEDVSGWSGADWVNKPYMYVFSTRSRCTTLTGSHFYNVRNAVELAGDDSLVEDNLIERFGNDGIDVIASNLIVRRNTIRDSRHTPAEPMHPDAIQGWTLRNATNRNILIDGNLILNPNTSDDNALQGISIFDGLWDGVRIVNNVVASNIWHGIALYGVENAEVINNTVVPVRPGKYMTWIAINPSKLRKPSSNIIVRNNIAGQIFASGQDIAVDHNIAAGPIKPAPVRAGMAPDRLTFANNMTGVPLESLFVDFDIPRAKLNFHLAPNSLARMAGSKENAPPVDRDGRPRVVPYDIGAYAR